jgi:hypothetical protein
MVGKNSNILFVKTPSVRVQSIETLAEIQIFHKKDFLSVTILCTLKRQLTIKATTCRTFVTEVVTDTLITINISTNQNT